MRSIINYSTFHLPYKKIRPLITHLSTAQSQTKQDKKEIKKAGEHTHILLLHKLWVCDLLTALCIRFSLCAFCTAKPTAIAFTSQNTTGLIAMATHAGVHSSVMQERSLFQTSFSLQYITSSQSHSNTWLQSLAFFRAAIRWLPNQISHNWTINHI